MKLFWLGMAALMSVWLQHPDQKDPDLDETDTVAIAKANFLFQFALGNEWPNQAKEGFFRIAVIGSPNVYQDLVARYASKPIGNQPIEVVLLPDAKIKEYYHMIYVGRSQDALLPSVIEQVTGKPTMVVSNAIITSQQGVIISFIIKDSMTRYVINAEEAEKRKILIGSKILSWAISN
ncbi:MAG: hypothetical protein ACJAU0_000495 [Flavobacteriales bacterium]|jgi:hypothetical protein